MLILFLSRAKYALVSSLTSNHGVPLGNLHTGELVTMYFKMHIFTTSKYVFIVLAKNILESSLMTAHDGHLGQTGYQCVPRGA